MAKVANPNPRAFRLAFGRFRVKARHAFQLRTHRAPGLFSFNPVGVTRLRGNDEATGFGLNQIGADEIEKDEEGFECQAHREHPYALRRFPPSNDVLRA